MLSLKEFLDRGFQRAFLLMNGLCFILLSVLIFFVSFLNSREQLLQNLSLSAKATTDYLYSREISKIADHFNAMGSSGVYSSVAILNKKTDELIFETQFPSLKIVPEFCSDNTSSDIVILKGCKSIISGFTLTIICLTTLAYLFCLIFIYRIVRTKTLVAFETISESLVDPSEEEISRINISEIQEIKTKLRKRSDQIAELTKSAALTNLSKQVAHDMRSPLAAILNISNLNVQGIGLGENDVILQSVARLNKIAQNLLDRTKNPKTLTLTNNQKFQLSKVSAFKSFDPITGREIV